MVERKGKKTAGNKQTNFFLKISAVQTRRCSKKPTTRNSSCLKKPLSSSERAPAVHDEPRGNNPQLKLRRSYEILMDVWRRRPDARRKLGKVLVSVAARADNLWPPVRASLLRGASPPATRAPETTQTTVQSSERIFTQQPDPRPLSSPSIHVWGNNGSRFFFSSSSSSKKKNTHTHETFRLQFFPHFSLAYSFFFLVKNQRSVF